VSSSEGDLRKVNAIWGRAAEDRAHGARRGWLDSPIVLEEIVQPRQTGSRSKNWAVGLAESLGLPKGGRWVSLGCGGGATELVLSRAGLFSEMVAYDASAAALDAARAAASSEGVTNIRFESGDLNALELPRRAFDVALMCMSLHHVRNLEGVLRAIARSLAPDGWFLVNEFVGARQFQFPARQIDIVNAFLGAMPERLRMDVTTGALKNAYKPLPVEHWNLYDPSEAVRSDEILEQVARRFEIVKRIDYGGTVLGLALEHIVHNFDEANPADVELVRLLGGIEDLLIRQGVLGSDFTILAARPVPSVLLHRLRAEVRRLLAAFGY
jgi:ubiquinone/menaquinone biosynthesis C-methylase UbiE